MKEEKDNKQEEKDESNLFEELTEEQIKELNDKLKNLIQTDKELKKRRSKALFFNYALHPKFGLHILLQWLINIFVLSAVIGLTNFGVVNNTYFYFLGVTAFTFVEILLKLLLFKIFQKPVIKSYGLIHLIYVIPLLYLNIELLGKISFAFLYQRLIILVSFLVLRLFASYYIKLIFYSRRILK